MARYRPLDPPIAHSAEVRVLLTGFESAWPQVRTRPVLAPIDAISLHYAFDLWSHVWRRETASGDVIVIR